VIVWIIRDEGLGRRVWRGGGGGGGVVDGQNLSP